MQTALPQKKLKLLIKSALKEDLGERGDVTSIATIPKRSRSCAKIVSKEKGVLCGIQVVIETFRQCDRKIKILKYSKDGVSIKSGQMIIEVIGNTRALLAAERTALNFIQRLSGIATLTRHFVEKAHAKSTVLDTRKTTPLLRMLEKYAVKCGGGRNHRFGLHDMVLIKDNHLAAMAEHSKTPLLDAARVARKKWPKLKVEVECDTLNQVREAVTARADVILLDNMTVSELRKAVKIVNGRSKTEASGGVNLKTISGIARTGVDFISVGALTHSARALDFSMEIERE